MKKDKNMDIDMAGERGGGGLNGRANGRDGGKVGGGKSGGVAGDLAGMAELQGEAAELKGQVAELTGDLQRTRADFENYRKQVEIQKAQAMEAARQATVMKVLPMLDNLDLAIRAHAELEPLLKTLEKTLAELKLERIDSEAGVEFNPDLHEAVMMEEGEGEREVILETLRPGYYYEGAVIRPAMVKVGRG